MSAWNFPALENPLQTPWPGTLGRLRVFCYLAGAPFRLVFSLDLHLPPEQNKSEPNLGTQAGRVRLSRSCLCLLPRAWKERDVSYEARLGGAASHCPLPGLVLVPSPASRESPGPRLFPVMVCPPNVSLSFSVSLRSASSGSLPSWVRCLRGEPRSCYPLQQTPPDFLIIQTQ